MLQRRSQSKHVLWKQALREYAGPEEAENGVSGTKAGQGGGGGDGRAGRRCCRLINDQHVAVPQRQHRNTNKNSVWTASRWPFAESVVWRLSRFERGRED